MEEWYGRQCVPAKISGRPGQFRGRLIRLRLVLRKLFCGPQHGRKPAEISSEISALCLRQQGSEGEYQDQLIRLIQWRHAVDTLPFIIPTRQGFIGAVQGRLRGLLWQLLRFQSDRLAFRQNQINDLLSNALEFEHLQSRRELEELRRRLAELEARVGQCGRQQEGGAT